VLPPTTDRLLNPDTVPYFLWDTRMTVAEARQVLAQGDRSAKDDLVARILREANSRDVWLFLDWPTIDDAWSRIQHRIGRARPVWAMMIDRHRQHVAEHGAAHPAS
jgi:hypothetical protein